MRYKKRYTTKPAPKKAIDRQLVVYLNRAEGEERRMAVLDINEYHNADMLKRGVIRLATPDDDRGLEVPFIATYGNERKTWFPETEGNYMLELFDLPDDLKGWRLGFGSVSCPYPTLAQLHRSLIDLLNREPKLRPFVRGIKRPCVFCADVPELPGGSTCYIDLNNLPPPADKKTMPQFFM